MQRNVRNAFITGKLWLKGFVLTSKCKYWRFANNMHIKNLITSEETTKVFGVQVTVHGDKFL